MLPKTNFLFFFFFYTPERHSANCIKSALGARPMSKRKARANNAANDFVIKASNSVVVGEAVEMRVKGKLIYDNCIFSITNR